MSNNFNLEKLALKGHFKRSKKTKQKERESLGNLDKISREMKENMVFKNQNFPFELNILYVLPNSGKFIARGDDFFGESVIYGIIKHGIIRKIEFKKIYIGDPKHRFSVKRADSVDYFGSIEVSKEGIYCSGTWETHPNSPENGTWKLDSNTEF